MKLVTVKTLAGLAIAGGLAFGLSSAQAMPGLDPGVAVGGGPKVEKAWCGPYGCRPGGPGYGYGWRPRPRPPVVYGYGPRPRPPVYGYGPRPRPPIYGPHPRPWGPGY
ncbi:hypothetical protein OGR47_17425 [Methylocystis sp. MJC1]|jgi:hypothetical protein|uniref:hypothetical protein n=1 Tax=Methylocystis sp. MJC1 TaxID=2654282 RepID=UPI0013EDEEC2|nr:hypothetical protein [Methylocystis sp. MJC1]KAF2990659.1 hypothetical protein MJC1_02083 [Methylocystis sp. MJC1]MBU6528740.1 hypothetical protein [Methylocystis sp. MJC1]UZX11627.1 hypothetical protein OGR47_17425 [Methylocystis sp. MJC1]